LQLVVTSHLATHILSFAGNHLVNGKRLLKSNFGENADDHSFVNLQILPELLCSHRVTYAVAIIRSLVYVVGGVDR